MGEDTGFLRMPGGLDDMNDYASAVEHKLQWSLVGLERNGGLTGWVARLLLSAGDWIDKELEERRQAIGGIDNMWFLLTDAADFNPVCASTYTFKGKLTLEQLYTAAVRQTEQFPKYKQRITSVCRRLHGAYFEDDPEFDIKNHVRAVTLPEPAGIHELHELMGDFIAQDWDLRRPLWEMVLVENFRGELGAESAMITRGHHALADGQGFVISQLYITSYHDELVRKMGSSRPNAAKKVLPSKLHRILRPLDRLADNPYTAPLVALLVACMFWWTYAVAALVTLYWSVYQAIHQIALFVLTCWRVDMLTGPQPGPRVEEREFASSRVFSIKDVKLCQQAFSGAKPGSAVAGILKEKRDAARAKAGHVTLNDVICSVMADVLGKEVASRPMGQLNGPWECIKRTLKTVLPSPIGFFIPMSVRTPGDWSMRNLSTGSIVYLTPATNFSGDVTIQELHAHIHACRRELSILKHSLLPKLGFELVQWIGQFPALLDISLLAKDARALLNEWVMRPVYNMALQSFPIVLTNVPGPADSTINLEGTEVLKWTALPPQAGKGTIGVGIISYAGGLSIAVAADKVPSSIGVTERICAGFEERFELYVQRAREVLEHLD